MGFLAQIVIALVMMVVSYLLMPKPKTGSATKSDGMDDPTASAGSPIKVVFGTVTIKDPNVLWYGDKSTHTFKTKA